MSLVVSSQTAHTESDTNKKETTSLLFYYDNTEHSDSNPFKTMCFVTIVMKAIYHFLYAHLQRHKWSGADHSVTRGLISQYLYALHQRLGMKDYLVPSVLKAEFPLYHPLKFFLKGNCSFMTVCSGTGGGNPPLMTYCLPVRHQTWVFLLYVCERRES